MNLLAQSRITAQAMARAGAYRRLAAVDVTAISVSSGNDVDSRIRTSGFIVTIRSAGVIAGFLRANFLDVLGHGSLKLSRDAFCRTR